MGATDVKVTVTRLVPHPVGFQPGEVSLIFGCYCRFATCKIILSSNAEKNKKS